MSPEGRDVFRCVSRSVPVQHAHAVEFLRDQVLGRIVASRVVLVRSISFFMVVS